MTKMYILTSDVEASTMFSLVLLYADAVSFRKIDAFSASSFNVRFCVKAKYPSPLQSVEETKMKIRNGSFDIVLNYKKA